MTAEISLTSEAEEFFDALVDQLSIGEGRYDQAYESYNAFGDWLHRPESTVRKYGSKVYVQGSFRLGTVIRPLSDEEDYDVDSVCEFTDLTTAQITQEELKKQFGDEVKAYHDARSMVKPVKEGRRCWTLVYSDGAQFHMDIVPSISDSERQRLLLETHGFNTTWSSTAIAITDNETENYRSVSDDWPRSNPKGYAEWFKQKMLIEFERRRRMLAEAVKKGVEEIPEYHVQTPLQSAIMILKRHRDMRFVDDKENKPISIIISTLAAHSYQSEPSIGRALISILQRMDQFIDVVDGKYVIGNPTDPMENFADKWEEHPCRQKAFFEWLEQVRLDFGDLSALTDMGLIEESVSPLIGHNLAKLAREQVSSNSTGLLHKSSVAPAVGLTFPDEPRVPTSPKGFA